MASDSGKGRSPGARLSVLLRGLRAFVVRPHYLWIGATVLAVGAGGCGYVERLWDGEEKPKPIEPPRPPEGFRALFNGKDLTGWKGLVADPPARAKMSPEELTAAQAAADLRMEKHWRVIDGYLYFDGHGDSLCTAEDFGDFELLVDWKIPPGGDSGIYLRGSPQVQIWDVPLGSGGLYNNLLHPSGPLVRADREPGEWNHFDIRMVGDRVTVWLNGVLVVRDTPMENYWERDKPIYPRGQIELQSHGGPLRFRNVFIRELTPEFLALEQQLTEAFESAGWTIQNRGR